MIVDTGAGIPGPAVDRHRFQLTVAPAPLPAYALERLWHLVVREGSAAVCSLLVALYPLQSAPLTVRKKPVEFVSLKGPITAQSETATGGFRRLFDVLIVLPLLFAVAVWL